MIKIVTLVKGAVDRLFQSTTVRVCAMLGVAYIAMSLMTGSAFAQSDDVTPLVTAAQTLFTTVKSLVVDIVGFGLLVYIALRVRRR